MSTTSDATPVAERAFPGAQPGPPCWFAATLVACAGLLSACGGGDEPAGARLAQTRDASTSAEAPGNERCEDAGCPGSLGPQRSAGFETEPATD